MICPSCKSELVTESVEGEEIEVCKKCSGMWLHKHQLDRMFKETGGEVELSSLDNDLQKESKPAIQCRECTGVTMEKINFLHYSDIIIDHCPSCGSFWVDKGELDNMHKYIEKVEKESHEADNASAYNFLQKLSRIAYNIFH